MLFRAPIAVVLLAFSVSAAAECVTSGGTTYCYDYNSGNSYSTTDYGASSITSGYNVNTGTVWGSDTFRSGNTSQTMGSSSNGNMWNSYTDSSGYTTYDSYNAETGEVKIVICDSKGNCY